MALVRDPDAEKMRQLRKNMMQEMMNNLFDADTAPSKSLSYLRTAIDRRADTELYAGNYDKRSNQHHKYCAITSCNMRGIKNKLSSVDGIDFWGYNKEVGSQFICIQDHHLLNSQSPRMIAAAGTVIPGMQNGSLVSQQSTSYTDKKQIRVGGVAALSGGILHRYRYKSIQDKRHWGRYVGRIIRGQTRIQQNKRGRKHKSDDRHRKYTNLAIISVYAAVDSSSPNSMWQQQCKGILSLPRKERCMRTISGQSVPDPHAQLRADLGRTIDALRRKENCNILLLGDFNINLHKHDRESQALVKWAKDKGMYNPYLERFGTDLTSQHKYISNDENSAERIHTWAQSDRTPQDEQKSVPHAHLDHVWASHDMKRRKCITSYSVPTHTIANTDHKVVTITLDISETLGISTKSYNTVPLKKRVLMFKNKKQCAEYAKQLTKTLDLSDIRTKVQQAIANPTKITKNEMDLIMENW